MPILASENKKNPVKNVAPSRNRTQASHNLWFQIQHYPYYTILTCATWEIFKLLFMHHLMYEPRRTLDDLVRINRAWL